MYDLYGLGSSGIPLEYSAELRRLQQQQMVAQSLMQQSQEPDQTNQMAGGMVVPYSPFQGLNKVAQAYLGAKMMGMGNDAYKAMGEKYTADQNAAIDKVKNAIAPRTLPDASAGPPATMPRSPDEIRAALVEAAMSPHQNVRNFATMKDAQLDRSEAREDTQKHQEMIAQLTRDQTAANLMLQLQDKQLGREQQAELMKELAKIKQQGGGSSPFYQFLPGENGYLVGNARTGQMTPAMIDGKPAIKASDSPALQGQLAGAKASGKEMGESQAKSEIGLPQTIDNANKTIQNIDDILAHPGFSSYVGATLKPFASKIDGTPEADVAKRIDEVKGGAFLQAFETLKGGGQITEVEGKKATDAITRMDKAQSEAEFKTAAKEFQQIIRNGVTRAQTKAGQIPSKLNTPGPSTPVAPAASGGWSVIK